jgi:hypothetical protein
MKHLYKLLLVIFLLPLFTLAQSNYKPGVIVTLKGDTLHGFIDYKEWENNPESINFKLALSGAAQQYTPNEITYFQVAQLDAYRRYSGPVSMDATNIGRLSSGKDTSYKTLVVFLKLEQDGRYISLYSYTDDLKKRYFVTEKINNEPFELVYRTYTDADKTYNTTNETKYKGQLIYLSSKYNRNTDELRTTIETSSYDQDLINIVSKINGSAKQSTHHTKSSISFYAGIGSGISSIKPPNNYYFYSSDYSYVNSYLPRISFGINAYTNPEVGKLVFKGEVALSANTFKTYFNQYFYSHQKSYITLNQYTVSLDPQVLYNIYNSDSFKFYVEAGVSFNLSKNSNNNLYSAGSTDPEQNYIQLNPNWFSVPLSAGITLNNKIGIYVSYIIPSVFSGNGFTYSSTQFGLTYTFGQKK